MDDLNFAVFLFFDAKCNRAFYSVQVIVQSGFRADEKRSGYTRQMQRFGKCAFKVVFYFFDCHFSLADRKWRMVILRYLQIVHDVLPFLLLTMSSLVN